MNRIFAFSLKLQNRIYLKQLHKSEQNLQGEIKENTITLLAIIFFFNFPFTYDQFPQLQN